VSGKIIIDGTIGKDYWGDDDTIISAKKVRDLLDEESGDIVIEINSAGGSVMEGITIHNLFRDYDKGSVAVVIVGMCASIATHIALAGDTVKAHDNAVFMIHNVSSWVGGDHNDMRKMANTLEGLTKLLAKTYTKKTGISEKEILKMMNDETWLYGAEIKAKGFIDAIIETKDNSNRTELVALAQETWNSTKEFVKSKSKESEQSEAEAFLKKSLPTNENKIRSLKARLDLKLKEINR